MKFNIIKGRPNIMLNKNAVNRVNIHCIVVVIFFTPENVIYV